MSEPKSFASLSSSLLARKGQARPAMRPQLITTTSTLEDLGWNDMGFDPAPEVPEAAEPVQATPEENPVGKAQNSIAEAFSPAPALSSGMVRKPALVPPVNGAKTPVGRAAPGSRGKAAFTLRLDNQRHLKLRVACAMSHRSAQQIVTDALDQFLDTLPDFDSSGWAGVTRN